MGLHVPSQASAGIKDIGINGNTIKVQYANGKTKDLDISSITGVGIKYILANGYGSSAGIETIYFTKPVFLQDGHGGFFIKGYKPYSLKPVFFDPYNP